MIQINCPFCGKRDHSEFTYGSDATIVYPELGDSAEQWYESVYLRDNIRGVQLETWHHVHGCRMWLVVERDTITHQIHTVRAAHAGIAELLATAEETRTRRHSTTR